MTDFIISGLPVGTTATIEIRAVNAIGPGPASAAKTATPSAVPDAFAPADWSVTPGEGEATVSVASLPAANGKPVTGVDYRLDGGAWTASGLTGTGSVAIPGLTGGQAYAVSLRARNANGSGPAGDTKSVTPTGSQGVQTPPHAPLAWWDLSDPSRMAVSGGLVDRVDDQAGALHLKASGTSRPAFRTDATDEGGPKGRVRFTAGDTLFLPAGLWLDSRAASVFVVHHGASTGKGSGDRQTLFHMAESSTDFALYGWDFGDLRVFDGGARSSGLRLGNGIETSWAIGAAANSWIGNSAQTVERGTAFGAKTPSGGRLGTWNGGSFPYSGDIHAVIVYDRALSLAEKDAVLAWAKAAFGAVPAAADTLIVFDGDSLTEGIQDTNPQLEPDARDFSYPQQIQVARGGAFRMVNTGRGGHALANATAATAVIGTLTAGAAYATRAVFGLWCHNDVQGGRTAAEMTADLDAWIANIRAADPGALIGHGTILPSGGFDSEERGRVDDFNAYIRDTTASGPDLDFRIDTEAIPALANPADSAVFVDGVHLTTAGYAALAEGVDAGLVAAGILPGG